MAYRPETPTQAQRVMPEAEGLENKALTACLDARRAFVEAYGTLAHSGADLTTLAALSRETIDAMRIAYGSALYDLRKRANTNAAPGGACDTPEGLTTTTLTGGRHG